MITPKITQKCISSTSISKKYYQQIISQDFILKQNYANIMEIPSIKAIVINTTSKYYAMDRKNLISVLTAFQLVTAQKPKLTYAKKSIANFKIRQSQILGCKTTLRGNRALQFLDKWCRILYPRIRDASQIHLKNLDNQGNYTLGINHFMIFPELEKHFELVETLRGLNITFVTKVDKKKNAFLLLTGFQMPSEFKN